MCYFLQHQQLQQRKDRLIFFQYYKGGVCIPCGHVRGDKQRLQASHADGYIVVIITTDFTEYCVIPVTSSMFSFIVSCG